MVKKNEIGVEGSWVMLVFRPVGRTRALIPLLQGGYSMRCVRCLHPFPALHSQIRPCIETVLICYHHCEFSLPLIIPPFLTA